MRALGTAAVLAVLLAVLLAVTACGNKQSDSATASPFLGCHQRGRVVARADLDGDGATEEVRFGRAGTGACAGALTARVDGTVSGVRVTSLDLSAKAAAVVHLHGPGDLVMVTSRPAANGRSRQHLYGAGRNGLTEVTAGGKPVLPAASTSPGSAPMTATCVPGGIAVVTATAHQPPGIVLAWDVQRTTYDLRNGVATRRGTSMVKTAAADPLLRKEMPELFDGRLFRSCLT